MLFIFPSFTQNPYFSSITSGAMYLMTMVELLYEYIKSFKRYLIFTAAGMYLLLYQKGKKYPHVNGALTLTKHT